MNSMAVLGDGECLCCEKRCYGRYCVACEHNDCSPFGRCTAGISGDDTVFKLS